MDDDETAYNASCVAEAEEQAKAEADASIAEQAQQEAEEHRQTYDHGFNAGYRRALCHFGKLLEDMKKTDEMKAKDAGYGLAHLQMCTRHEEMVDLINHTPIHEIIGGKEGKWTDFDEKQSKAANEGLASLFG